MGIGIQKLCAGSGLVFVALMFGSMFLLTPLVPPPSPAMDAAAIASLYAQNHMGLLIGLSLAMTSTFFFVPWAALISLHMTRMEGVSPVLSLIQAIGAAVVVLVVLIPVMCWVTAAYRVDRAPEIVQVLNDFGWLFLVMTFPVPTVQLLAIGIATLSDKSVDSVFPRWAGYFNLWMGVLFIPGVLVGFFFAGPFAWNGVIGFWIPVVAFVLWFILMTPVLFRAIRQQEGRIAG
jgi:MFS family permease